MIRSYCFEKDWDEGIHLLLFAVRESVQESYGFSPFELVFGHSVRGPLKLLKEKFLSNDETPLNLLQYVSDFGDGLSGACGVAGSNLRTSRGRMRARYDNHVVDGGFKPGDRVLALLPVPGGPLQAGCFGPCAVGGKTGDLGYLIDAPGGRRDRRVCHVDVLREYFGGDGSISEPITVVNTVPQESDVFEPEVGSDFVGGSGPGPSGLGDSDILGDLDSELSHLEPSRRGGGGLGRLMHGCGRLFPDIPTRTDKIYHDVIVEDSKPIKQHPYRMNPLKQKYLQVEVKYLLKNYFIEPSQSNCGSPCVLVPESGGACGVCAGCRGVSSVTKTDSFPIPRIDDCIDKVGNSKYVTKFDLLKGFW